jgi:alkylation response protein AidB-like acyl-CoA dehydrogenase
LELRFTDEDDAFRLAARDWLKENVPRTRCPAGGPDARAFATAWLKRLHAAGWSGLSWPQEYGGQGLSPVRRIIWHEEYAQAGAPSPLDPTFVALNHAGPTLMACGTQAQKAFHLPKILAGDAVWCQGFSEPDSGSDLASITTSDIADYQELLLRTESRSRGNRGLSWAICDMRAPGITIRPIENLAGTCHFSEVTYDDVRIPLDQVVGAPGDGWQVAMTTLGFERGTAAIALQLALLRKVETLREAAAARGVSTGSGLMERLAVARAEALALRSLTYQSLFREPDSVFEASVVRLFFAELAQRIHRIAMDLHEADGVDFDAGEPWVEDYLESFSETIAGGTAEIQRNIIGERILGLPRAARP